MHGMFGRVSIRELRELASLSYRTRQGFAPGVFEVILAPVITAIDPDEGYNIAPIKINKISGANFLSGAAVKLKATGEAEIAAYDINVVSSSEINCEFNLAGAAEGFRDVVVTNPDETEGTLPSGFRIRSYPLSLGLAVNSPNPFDPARESTTITYKLEKDTGVNVYMFTTTADLIWKRSCNAGENGGSEGDNSISWNGITDFREMASNGVYILHVVERNTGKTLARGKIAVLRR